MKVVPTAEKDETEKSKEQNSNPKGKMNQEEGTLNLSLGIAYVLGQISINYPELKYRLYNIIL